MKSILSLRLLCLLGFLLLIAPFYESCGKKALAPAEEVMVDTTAIELPAVKNNILILEEKELIINEDSIAEIKRNKTPFYQKAYELIDDEETLNAYEFAVNSLILFEGSFSEFKKDIKKENYGMFIFHLRNFSFLFIVLFSIAILILSFFNRFKLIHKFSKIILVLLFITIICSIVIPFFETYNQFKWGYYAFTFVQLGILYTSKLQISNSKHQLGGFSDRVCKS